ncbi:hypothetical protein EIP91_012264 [Steccherinum ochraceum]|uniref:Uncharacterized protein n=1 Tax=Steccherinum ochraceum TaxID=92696 RepID=A0A4V2MWU2_9APHY|nr:hypothetical protein EIP91_012264 [Steccherinum ochraceum]
MQPNQLPPPPNQNPPPDQQQPLQHAPQPPNDFHPPPNHPHLPPNQPQPPPHQPQPPPHQLQPPPHQLHPNYPPHGPQPLPYAGQPWAAPGYYAYPPYAGQHGQYHHNGPAQALGTHEYPLEHPPLWPPPAPHQALGYPPAPQYPPPPPYPQQPLYPPAQPHAHPPNANVNHPAMRTRPNAEPRPGVFRFAVEIFAASDTKRTFTAETDMPYDDFDSRVRANLDGTPVPMTIAFRISGERGGFQTLATAEDFASVVERVAQKARGARSKPVSLEIKNLTPPPPSSSNKKGKGKRTREDDIPSLPEDDGSDEGDDTQLKAFKRLEKAVRCESHHGHCYVRKVKGEDTHRRLNHGEMTLWAKMISLGEADVYNPPNTINFDSVPKKPRNSNPSGTSQQSPVHVTIQNIHSSGFPSSSSISSQVSGEYTDFPYPSTQPRRPSTPPDQWRHSGFTTFTEGSSIDSSWRTEISDLALRHGITDSERHGAPSQAIPYYDTTFLLFTLDRDQPGFDFLFYEPHLRELSLNGSDSLCMIPIDLLSRVGDMGRERASRLQRYAMRNARLAFGFQRATPPTERSSAQPQAGPSSLMLEDIPTSGSIEDISDWEEVKSEAVDWDEEEEDEIDNYSEESRDPSDLEDLYA